MSNVIGNIFRRAVSLVPFINLARDYQITNRTSAPHGIDMRYMRNIKKKDGPARGRHGSKCNRTSDKCREQGHLWRVVKVLPNLKNAKCKCARCHMLDIVQVKLSPTDSRLIGRTHQPMKAAA